MPNAARPVVFLSDYGLDDEFVGVVHRVVVRDAPGVAVVDLTHRIRAHDVRAGALTLWRSAPWLHTSVVLAVVDPGVGTPRRAVALEVGEASTVLVGPDNGLLVPAAAALGATTGAVELRPFPAVPGAGSTFDGRDLFAPAAARLASGEWDLADAGDPIDPATLEGTRVSVAEPVDGELVCEVLWVDRFGNAQLNATPAGVSGLGVNVEIEHSNWRDRARRVDAFAELAPGELGLVTDSYGLIAVALYAQPAATRLGLRAGDTVRLTSGGDGRRRR